MTFPIHSHRIPHPTPSVDIPTPPATTEPQAPAPLQEGTEGSAPAAGERLISEDQTQAVQDADFNPLGFEMIEQIKEVGSKAKAALNQVASETFIYSAKRSAKAGHHENAIKILDKLLEQDPDNSEAVYLLGNNHRSLGDNEKALELYDQSIALNPENARAMTNKGYVLSEQGNHAEALELYTQAVEIMQANEDPYASLAMNNLGMAHQELGDIAEAGKHFAKAASAGSELARENLENLLEQYPDNALLQQHLESLKAIQQGEDHGI